MKRACIIHDWVNLILVPLIGLMTIAGLSGHLDPSHVTHAFLMYVVGDFVWVALQPEAVPSLPTVILAHHVVTFVLLCVPLRHPHLHWYTCVDGLVELNTFFLIARRQWRSRTARKLFSWLYWTSFLSMRMVLYPLMVPIFLREMRAVENAVWWDTLACVGSQVILCGFNVVLLALSIMNRRKRRTQGDRKDDAKDTSAAAAAPSKATGLPTTRGGAAGAGPKVCGPRVASGRGTGSGELLTAAKAGVGADGGGSVALRARAV